MSTCLKDGFCVAPRKEAEIRIVAEQMRKILSDHPDFKYLDIVRVLEFRMPEAFPGFRYEIVDSCEMPDREAEMNPSEFCIRIQEPIYIKAMKGDGHCRFTLAHELGHFFMHRTQPLAFGHRAINGNIPPYMNSEWQADIFARNLLAPFSMTRGLCAQEIETLFGVSRNVAHIIAGTKVHSTSPLIASNPMSQMTFPF